MDRIGLAGMEAGRGRLGLAEERRPHRLSAGKSTGDWQAGSAAGAAAGTCVARQRESETRRPAPGAVIRRHGTRPRPAMETVTTRPSAPACRQPLRQQAARAAAHRTDTMRHPHRSRRLAHWTAASFVALAGLSLSTAASARVDLSIGLGFPLVYPSAPVYVAPPPVYVPPPRPVYYGPQPGYLVVPPPAVAYPAPGYIAPPPTYYPPPPPPGHWRRWGPPPGYYYDPR